ncbi:hypothetical protein, partial [Thiolapillus sp.]
MIRDVLYRAVGRVIHAEKIQCGLPRPVSSRPECKRATGIVVVISVDADFNADRMERGVA